MRKVLGSVARFAGEALLAGVVGGGLVASMGAFVLWYAGTYGP